MFSKPGEDLNRPFYLAMTGALATLWTARAAFLLYVAALAAWLARKPRAARILWTAGWLVYLGHAAAAFTFYHHWSHRAAYAETARRTAELFGVRSGAGLYWNYAFTLVWTADVIWLWCNAPAYRGRPRSISIAFHSFLAFMFFNATVVFGSGWLRGVGLAAAAGLGAIWLRSRPASAKLVG